MIQRKKHQKTQRKQLPAHHQITMEITVPEIIPVITVPVSMVHNLTVIVTATINGNNMDQVMVMHIVNGVAIVAVDIINIYDRLVTYS